MGRLILFAAHAAVIVVLVAIFAGAGFAIVVCVSLLAAAHFSASGAALRLYRWHARRPFFRE